jgi:hypothetical protein
MLSLFKIFGAARSAAAQNPARTKDDARLRRQILAWNIPHRSLGRRGYKPGGLGSLTQSKNYRVLTKI